MSRRKVLPVLRAGAFALVATLALGWSGAEAADTTVPIRLGWQIPAATQGQILQVLKRTDVLEQHGLDPSFIPFSYGGPQVDAAFAGELDIFFAGDQPAINLIARGGRWKIVARLFDDRIAYIVPPNSPVQTVEDLRGKIVASPFGSVAHREAFLAQQAVGLDVGKDFKNIDLDILEIRRRVLAGGVETWEGIDAAVVWEPIVSRFQLEGLARSVTDSRTLGVVAVSDEFIASHPEAIVQFLVALMRAWDFLSRQPDEVMQWYIRDTRLDYTPETLVSARLDRNFGAKSLREIDLGLSEKDIVAFERGAAWGREAGVGAAQIREAVDLGPLAQAEQAITTGPFEDIRVILPAAGEAASSQAMLGSIRALVALGAVFVALILIALLAMELGIQLGRHSRKKLEDAPFGPVATVVGAVLGMMAFVIALTFGSANSRFDARKAALLDDVTAIQTAYLRASLLPEPQRTTVRSLLRDYVQVRVGIVNAYDQPETLRLVRRRAEGLQELMWSHVETLAESDTQSRVQGLFASSLNDMFNLHTKRVVLGAYYSIPGFVWLALILASTVAMVAVGFQFGIGGGRRVHTASLALAMTFALVMLLAFDLDRTGEGLIAVNQQPMIDLYQSMGTRR
jgi:ABC-type nitrate/sulfonate/bicarbonate transport system substrate-binding protein